MQTFAQKVETLYYIEKFPVLEISAMSLETAVLCSSCVRLYLGDTNDEGVAGPVQVGLGAP